jgi:hypothetical protein
MVTSFWGIVSFVIGVLISTVGSSCSWSDLALSAPRNVRNWMAQSYSNSDSCVDCSCSCRNIAAYCTWSTIGTFASVYLDELRPAMTVFTSKICSKGIRRSVFNSCRSIFLNDSGEKLITL